MRIQKALSGHKPILTGGQKATRGKTKMLPSLYSAKEECLLCGDSISNPICHACLESDIEEWLSDRMPRLIQKLKKTGQAFKSYTHPGLNCILCGNNMNICSQCYCYEVNRLFDNYPRLAEEFIEFFNFELRGGSRSLDGLEA